MGGVKGCGSIVVSGGVVGFTRLLGIPVYSIHDIIVTDRKSELIMKILYFVDFNVL